MKKNFLITTGGSGGHVIPATILYDHLEKKANVIISTDKRGLKYLDKDIYKFNIIDTPKLNNIFFFFFYLIFVQYLTVKFYFLYCFLSNNHSNKKCFFYLFVELL